MKALKKFEEFMDGILEWGGIKKNVILLVISGVALLLSLSHVLKPLNLPFDIAWVSIILCGVPIVLEAITGLITRFDIKADVLVSIALVASVFIHEDFAAGEVAFIMQLGALLEDLTVARARAGIEKLVHLTPTTARRIKDGAEEIIAADAVLAGDILKVLPGETVPVDGIIISGQTSINQAVMTGESLPVDKAAGDEVSSGTVNQFGAFEMKATKVGEDSSIQRMIRLVQSADAGKAKIVGLADSWATWVVVIALSAALITGLVTKEIIRAVTILVVFCPCSLVLATPTAIMAAIGNATKHGFLVREGDALERLAKVKRVTFDKTGTLTVGVPKVTLVQVLNDSISSADFYRIAASVEQNSEHPLGKAVVRCYKEQRKLVEKVSGAAPEGGAAPVAGKVAPETAAAPQAGKVALETAAAPVAGKVVLETAAAPDLAEVSGFEMIPGRGVKGLIDGKAVMAGNTKMMKEAGIEVSEQVQAQIQEQLSKGSTVILVSIDNQIAGFIALSDSLREDSAKMIGRLNQLGVVPVLLTGDNEAAANQIAGELGITEVHSNCLPEDKLNFIDGYQSNNQPVCMIGDGVNDAPALKKAMVGIAMGGVGSDIAVDAADIALVDDEVKELPHLFALSQKMMRKIKFNLSFSMLLNFVAIVLAITGILNPVVGALVHNCGSVFVIINSAFLLSYKK